MSMDKSFKNKKMAKKLTGKKDLKNAFLVIGLVVLFIVAIIALAMPRILADKDGKSVTNNPDYLILVNKQNKLPDDWNFRMDFNTGRNALGELYIVESEALRDYENLRNYLLDEEGVQIELDSTYRSVEEQQEIWDAWSADPEKGPDYCAQYLSPVGYSEHHTGLAIDVFLMKDGKEIRDNDEMIADTEDFAKVHKHLAKFGFILRYLEGKEDVTGYSYEPWHFRYIGDKEIAKYIMDNGLTLEEYLAEKK